MPLYCFSTQRQIFLRLHHAQRHVRQLQRQEWQPQIISRQRAARFHVVLIQLRLPSRNNVCATASSSSSSLALSPFVAISVPARHASGVSTTTTTRGIQNITTTGTRQSSIQQQSAVSASSSSFAILRKRDYTIKKAVVKDPDDDKLFWQQNDHSLNPKLHDIIQDHTNHAIAARERRRKQKQKQQQQQQQQQQQLPDVAAALSPQTPSSAASGKTISNDALRRLAAQCLPHWLSRRDRVWRNRTMQHLNLIPPTTTTTPTTTIGTTTLKSYQKNKVKNSSMVDHDDATSSSSSSSSSQPPIPLFQDDDDESSLSALALSSSSTLSQRLSSSHDLYYDSFDSFHERIQQHVGDDIDTTDDNGNKTTTTTTTPRTTTISNDLQQALDELVATGFAKYSFVQRFQQYEGHQARVENWRVKMTTIRNGELPAWQRQRDHALRQRTKVQRQYDELLLQQQQQQASVLLLADADATVAGKSDTSRSSTSPKEQANSNAQSPVGSLLAAFKGFLFPTTTSSPPPSSSTESQQDETTALRKKATMMEQKQASLLVKKRHDLERKIKSLERSLANCDSKIQSLRQQLDQRMKKMQALEQSAPMTLTEYESTNEVVERVMNVVCQDLARHIDERHSHVLEQYRVLDAKTDLTKPHEWFPYARLDCRKIIFHGGPTNSGKTYAALERLKQASKGMYYGPLRLLAAEVYEQLTMAGIYCNLYTGQERREIPFATHGAATVEMASLVDDFDIVVIDEIQMISDPERGFAWTKALLGSRCKEIHVCGGMEALDIVRRLAQACGDDFECRQYQRFTPLKVAKKSLARSSHQKDSYRNVKPGDCIVAFSRNDIFAIKREIETTTKYKCTVIYGSLPPQTRSEQARLFNDPNSGYDILVASDAIGMGLNLNIRRIVFNSIFKNDGNGIVRLGHSAVKQISGRAGRRNSMYPNGEVTTRCPEDMEYLRKCMGTEINSVERAGLLPTANHIDAFSSALEHYGLGDGESNKLHKTLQRFSEMASVQSDFFLGRQTEMHRIARAITSFPLTIREKYTLCMCPVNSDSSGSMDVLRRFASKLAAGETSGLTYSMVPRKPKSFDELSKLCHIFSELDLFLWLQHKFPPGNIMEQQAALARKELTIGLVNEALGATHTLKLSHCYLSRDHQLREAINGKNRRPRPGNREGNIRNIKKHKSRKGRGQEWNRGVPDI